MRGGCRPSAAPTSPKTPSRAPARCRSIRNGWRIGIAKVLDDNCIVFDETIAQNQLHDYLGISQPGAYFHNPASSGGWAPGAAFGAKLAAPEQGRDRGHRRRLLHVRHADPCAVGGEALQGAVHGDRLPEPQLFDRHAAHQQRLRPKDSYAAKADYDGGYFDPPIDFAKEAEAAGAYGENVTDSAQVEGALRRGLKAIREEGRPAVISVWLAKLLQKD